MQKTKFISREFLFFFFFKYLKKKKKKKNAKNKIRFRKFFFIKINAKIEKLTRSYEIISQSIFSVMSFERDNKSWPRDNQPIRLLLMT